MPRPKLIANDSPKRQAVMSAALALFADRGFHGTTIPDVAERAKVGLGTVYRYFGSKEKLVNHLYQHWKLEYAKFLMLGLQIDQNPQVTFGNIWQRMWRFYEKHDVVIRFLELHHHGTYLDKKSLALEVAVLQPLEAFIQHHQDRGNLSKRPTRLLMALVYGAFLGMVHGAIRKHLVITDDLLAHAEDAIWDALISPQPVRRNP